MKPNQYRSAKIDTTVPTAMALAAALEQASGKGGTLGDRGALAPRGNTDIHLADGDGRAGDASGMRRNDTTGGGESAVKPIGAEQLRKFTEVLQKYKAGKTRTEQRIVSSENWWKLRNESEEYDGRNDGQFRSRSGWLHNVIVSKHADAMESFPEPNILPREEGDRTEARMLSAIIPCVLEQNEFEKTYNDAMWQKMKTGTGVYKVIWDKNKLGGLGDIGIERVSILNLYWEPGVTDIQKSRYLFHTELCDKDVLEETYPTELAGGLKGDSFISTRFLYDDHVSVENKATVIDVYYHKTVNGKNTLQYCKYVGDKVLFATENDIAGSSNGANGVTDAPMAVTGLYDHGRYPYVFDPLFPIEGSPCGYGFVDICKNPQTEIDIFKTGFAKNVIVGSTPRYFTRIDGNINEEEFLDLTKPLVHAGGDLSDISLRAIDHPSLDSNYISMLDHTIQELRETSGNTETATGNATSGITAASAIAALQEASGKGSRDSTQGSYRAYSEIVSIVIELIRQFYTMPRKFRITGEMGAEAFVSYTNAGIRPQHQGYDFGQDMGYRLPVFDIKVSAQKKNVYTKVSQNELAIQFFQLGFFNPQMADQAMMCLEMMDFDGKDSILQKVARNGTLLKKLAQYMQISLAYAQSFGDIMAYQQIAADMSMTLGQSPAAMAGGISLPENDHIRGGGTGENTMVANARERASTAAQPDGGRVISER